jgi:peptidoglycan/xylan/chitin deacetylase (PgdA/CDA1 family)
MKTPHFPNRAAGLLCAVSCVLFATGPSEAREDCGPETLGTSRVVAVDGSEKLALGLQSYPQTLALNDREVVLTFDDGPAANTAAVLDALKEQCVRATFFVIGRNAAAMPRLVKRELSEGHSVGHHTMTHPARTLRSMSENAARADIERGFHAVDKAAYGSDADAAPRTPFFRFPGFADTPALVSWLEGRGVAIFGADLWASDWQEMTPKVELDRVIGRLEKAGKGIILFHDPQTSTAKMMPEFLRELKKRGFKIVHMVAGAGPTPVEKASPSWASATEAILAKTLGRHRHDASHKASRHKDVLHEPPDSPPSSSEAPEQQGM